MAAAASAATDDARTRKRGGRRGGLEQAGLIFNDAVRLSIFEPGSMGSGSGSDAGRQQKTPPQISSEGAGFPSVRRCPKGQLSYERLGPHMLEVMDASARVMDVVGACHGSGRGCVRLRGLVCRCSRRRRRQK